MLTKVKKKIMLKYARSFLGTPYRWGGETPQGIDCSGLAQEILRSVGIDPVGDQTANALFEYFKNNETKAPDPGNLVFWPSSGRKTHVAMIFDEETIIEAAGGGSRTKTTKDAEKDRAFVRLRPINNRGANYVIVNVI